MAKNIKKQFGTTNYPVGDFLVQIKNAAMAGKREIVVRNTKLIKEVAGALKELGYLESTKEEDGALTVTLTYKKREPVILDVVLVSKPGLRVYWGADELESIKKPSYFIISTNKGIMTSKKAIKERVGGEVIAEVL